MSEFPKFAFEPPKTRTSISDVFSQQNNEFLKGIQATKELLISQRIKLKGQNLCHKEEYIGILIDEIVRLSNDFEDWSLFSKLFNELKKGECELCLDLMHPMGIVRKRGVRMVEHYFDAKVSSKRDTSICKKSCLSVLECVLKEKKNFVLSRESIKIVNTWRKSHGLSLLMLRQKDPPKPSTNEIERKINDEKLGRNYFVNKLRDESREESIWYKVNGVDYLSIQIEFPKLIELLTRHPTFCSKDGCGMLSVLDIKSIQTVGVVLRIPFICGAGHKSFFDTSSQCENNVSKYLLNQIEGFSISLSGVRLPQLKLYNILKGVPSYSYSSMKTTSTAYFKRVQTKEVKEEKFNRVRTEYIIKHLLLYVDRRCALMYLGSVEFSLGIAEKVVECSRKLPGFFGDIFVSALIWKYMYGDYMYFSGESDGRYDSPGFSAMSCTGFFVESLSSSSQVLFFHSQSKARTDTDVSRISTNSREIKIGELYAGPSAELERICIRMCFKEMRDWRTTFSRESDTTDKLTLGCLVGSLVADRDAKVSSEYLNIFEELILAGKCLLCIFYTCKGHNKGALKKMVLGVSGEKFALRAVQDMEFALSNFRKTPQFKSLLKTDKFYSGKVTSLVSDIFLNCLLHHCGKCHCDIYNFKCKKESSTVINTELLKGAQSEHNLREAYLEFSKLWKSMIDQRTTSKIENKNSSIASAVLKLLDYKETYEGRVLMKLMKLMFKQDYYLEEIINQGIPICSHTLSELKLQEINSIKSREYKIQSKVKDQRYIVSQKLRNLNRSRSTKPTYYSSSKEEKLARETSISEISDVKIPFSEIINQKSTKGLTKRKKKTPKVKTLRNLDEIESFRKAKKEGLNPRWVWTCKYCKKDVFTHETREGIEKHISLKHKRALKSNYSANIEKTLITDPKK